MSTLEELLDNLLFASRSKTEQGSKFEVLMASYLRTAPEYADRFGEVHLWHDWPQRQGRDTGIDLVARDVVTGGWCAIQCKFYAPDQHLAKKDIDSFIAASNTAAFTSRMVISTARDWGSNLEAQMATLTPPVVRVGVHDLLGSKVDWSAIDWEGQVETVLPTTGKKTLRPHQREAKDAVLEGLLAHDRGQLVMACGTGKTFTSLKIAEQVALDNKARATQVLFLVPSIQLLNQTLREWKQESEIPFRAFAVCSDNKVGRRTSEDVGIQDLIYPATTDTAVLARELRTRHTDEAFTVVFSTYQSIDVVARAQAEGMPDFDLIICDEAHRTTGVTLAGEDESAFVRVHSSAYLKARKRLYMTATPRLFNPDTKDKGRDADAVLASMDDEATFGPVLHRLGFGAAVERDLLTDYKVLVLTVDEGSVSREFQEVLATSGELKLEDAAKLIGCWNGLAKRFDADHGLDPADLAPMRTAVAFASTIKASKAAAEGFPAIVDRLIATYADAGDHADHPNRMAVTVQHVDGTMNALERGRDLEWLKSGAAPAAGGDPDDNVCRVLTNVRCLSEGVDVPALDAVLFLSPRSSQVDVVQSVGRVMRKAPGKRLGYIILPVVIPAGSSPEEALRDNKRFQTVWQVLQALRAHDDRFSAMVNQLDLNTRKDDRVKIFDATPRREPAGDGDTTGTQLSLPFGIEQWRDAIYARIVQKVGERRYWQRWAEKVADVAQAHITRIHGLLADPDSVAAREFDAFLNGLRGNLNDGITAADAVEMLAQHLITRPIFEALFAGYDFVTRNPVAQTMERMLAVLDEHSLDTEARDLEKFYDSVRLRLTDIDNAEGRQSILVGLYNDFFAKAFKRRVDKLGIVYTPVEIVDFILRSADEVLRAHFGQGLTDEGVHILDGFTGTGTFLVRLLQLGLIAPHDLARKYAHELHANEILLLAYYIAAVNIETTFHDVLREQAPEQAAHMGYAEFPGLVLTDTFQSYEDGDEDDLGVFPENNERINRQRKLPITVIIGNPPYSVGQGSANDNNANDKYPGLDNAIEATYASRSSAASKRTLYDAYVRAIKWASLRIKDRGVIAYVTNGGWLDANTADGMRLSLADEFSAIHVVNLRGNQRTAGEQSRKEGGKVFGGGSRATVAITLLVKDPHHVGLAKIHYTDIGDYLTREDKLAKIAAVKSMTGMETVIITPNASGDWFNQRTDDFANQLPIGDKGGSPAIFGVYSLGLATGRDAWVGSFGAESLAANLARMVNNYNECVRTGVEDRNPTRISWNRNLDYDFKKRRTLRLADGGYRRGAYRPFTAHHVYLDRSLNAMIYRLGELFPTREHTNIGFVVMGPRNEARPAVLMLNAVPDLAYFTYAVQFFARWRYVKVEDEGAFSIDVGDTVGGYRRVDNITDEALRRFHTAYGKDVTKDDIFFYCYGLLHSPDYRDRYSADLKKMLPRIPLVTDPWPFVGAGRALADLHLGYESVTPYPLGGLDVDGPGGEAAYGFFGVTKMAFPKVRVDGKLVADRASIVYNDAITLTGVPQEAYRYQLGSRSAIEWILDRYQVKTDKASGIVNDPNVWSREVGQPRYILDLLARIVTVSLETMKIVDALPALAIREGP